MKAMIKFYERTFSDENSKEAYLKVCKWLAKNVISKVEVGETSYKIERVKEAELPTFKVELYCNIDENEFQKPFCNKCQEFHKSFYINQEYNCNSCKMKAYLKTIEERLSTKRSWRKERLDYVLKNEE